MPKRKTCYQKKPLAKLIQLKESYDLCDIRRIRSPVRSIFALRQKHFAGFIQRSVLSLSLSVSVSVSLCLSLCLSVCLSLCLSLCLSVSLSVSLCVSLCLCLCTSLSLSLSLSIKSIKGEQTHKRQWAFEIS